MKETLFIDIRESNWVVSPHAFLIYSWDDAPEWAKALSEHGGDEEGVLICALGRAIPDDIARIWDGYMCEPQVVDDKDRNLRVVIWAHG